MTSNTGVESIMEGCTWFWVWMLKKS